MNITRLPKISIVSMSDYIYKFWKGFKISLLIGKLAIILLNTNEVPFIISEILVNNS